MKVISPEIESYGASKKRIKFEIAETKLLMDLLENTLYQDKIRAVIRELCTNAMDATNEAAKITGKKRLPYVTLPKHGQNLFSVRDFGTGLSKEAMEKMYQTYGMSTKTDNNDTNGCMGIGSKSPFAYASQWTATSYYNGMKYVYVNGKDRNGENYLDPVWEGPTDEPNGLEVSFIVNDRHFSSFTEKFFTVMRAFPEAFPNSENITSEQCRRPTVELVPGVHVFKGGSQYHRTSSAAFMGWVEYPIETSLICGHEIEEEDETTNQDVIEWYQHYRNRDAEGKKVDRFPYKELLNLGLALDFDIGTINMAASREGLEYIDSTVIAIRTKLHEIYDLIIEGVEKSLADCKNGWEKSKTYHDVLDKRVLALAQKELNLKRNFTMDPKKEWTAHRFGRSYRRGSFCTQNRDITSISVTDTLILNDLPRGGHARIRWRFKDPKYQNTYGRHDQSYVLIDLDSAKNVMETLDCSMDDFTLISTFDAPPKSERKANNQKVFKFDPDRNADVGNSRWNKSYWENVTVDMEDGGVYIPINNWNVISSHFGDYATAPRALAQLIRQLKQMGIVVPSIYGLKKDPIKKFEKADGWVEFSTWLKETLDKYVKTANLTDKLKVVGTWNASEVPYVDVLCSLKGIQPADDIDEDLVSLCEYQETATQYQKETLEARRFLQMSLEIDEDKKNELNELHDRLVKRYPVVEFVSSNDIANYPDKFQLMMKVFKGASK